MTSQFGRILVASQIEEAIQATLQKWLPTFLREIEDQLGITQGSLPHPQNYTNRNSFDAQPGEKIPKIVIISPGLEGAPTRTGSTYRASWRVGVGVADGAKTERVANMRIKAYGAAIRDILIKKQNLDGNLPGIAQIVWLNETYDDLPIPDQLQLYKAASLFFTVDVENVSTRSAGPLEPATNTDVLPDYSEVETVIIELDKTEV